MRLFYLRLLLLSSLRLLNFEFFIVLFDLGILEVLDELLSLIKLFVIILESGKQSLFKQLGLLCALSCQLKHSLHLSKDGPLLGNHVVITLGHET